MSVKLFNRPILQVNPFFDAFGVESPNRKQFPHLFFYLGSLKYILEKTR